MCSPTSSEGSRLVKIVVLCAQTRVPGPRGHRERGTLERSAAHFDRPAQQANKPRAKRQARSVFCHSLVVDSTFMQSENITI